MNLLDDCLSRDRDQVGALTPALVDRVVALALYGKDWGAQAALLTCSAFGGAAELATTKAGLLALKPHEAMYWQAMNYCRERGEGGRVGLLTTFKPASISMREEWLTAVEQEQLSIDMVSLCAEGALEALNAGNYALHDQLLLAIAPALADCDVIMLGQFSMCHVRAQIEKLLGKPVLSSPDSAVLYLKSRFQPGAGRS